MKHIQLKRDHLPGLFEKLIAGLSALFSAVMGKKSIEKKNKTEGKLFNYLDYRRRKKQAENS